MWWFCWKNPLWIITLSCNRGSMRLRPECPWEHGGKESFLKYQSNTDIFFLILLLLPSKLSNDHLTNKKFVNDFEDKFWFSKIELLHHLFVVLVENVEEDGLLPSKPRTQREREWFPGSMSVRGGDVVGVLTLLVGGVAQAFHDDRVVELRVQLGVQEVEGKRQGRTGRNRKGETSQRGCAMMMTMDECEKTQDLSQWGVGRHQVWKSALRARSTHGVHHAIVEVNIVIGVVLGEVFVARLVPLDVDAVLGLTLGLIAHVIVVVFVVVILHRIFLCMGDILFTPPVGDSKLLLAVTEYHCNYASN